MRRHWEPAGWNDYRIVARGSEITLWINGVLTTQVNDHQTNQAARRGILGFQMHPGPPMKVQFKGIQLSTLTSDTPAQNAEAVLEPSAEPGFTFPAMRSP